MRPPHFWSADLDPYSRESAPFVRFLLTPFAWLYAWGTARRVAKTQPAKVASPVICVGNLTSGGSGKTPVVAALRALLAEQGFDAVSLSRGYGGSEKGPLKVKIGEHTARQVGDEPLLLAATGEAWIGRDKVETATTISLNRKCVILLDDGHQNPALHKDVSLVVIDAAAPFGNGYVLPKGPLREPVVSGLKRADAVVLMGDGEVPDIVTASRLPVFRAGLQQSTPIPDGPLLAFAGIGRPERFFEHVARAGGDLRDTAAFSDHHKFTKAELARLRDFADVHGAALITTEKDFVRLPLEERDGITAIKVRAEFQDTERVMAFLSKHLQGGHA